jgi:hypothetical protein
MENKIILLFYLLALISIRTNAQVEDLPQGESLFCTPRVTGAQKPKGVIFKYELIPKYNITSTSKNSFYDNASSGISRNGRTDFKIKIPVLNRPGLAIVGGLRYFQEQIHFTSPTYADYPVYVALEDRSLKSMGAQLYLIKPTKKSTYYLFRGSADLNGDFTQKGIPLRDFMKVSISTMYGWKRNDNLSYAFGLAYGYSFGRASIYPLFSYNRNFSSAWGIESLLPTNIKLRYSKNEKSFWYVGAALDGASYRLSNKIVGLEETSRPHLHRSELKLGMEMERELHDWLWISFELGFRQNLQFNLTNSGRRNGDVLINNKLSGAPYIGVGLFMVPPKKFSNYNKNQ